MRERPRCPLRRAARSRAGNRGRRGAPVRGDPGPSQVVPSGYVEADFPLDEHPELVTAHEGSLRQVRLPEQHGRPTSIPSTWSSRTTPRASGGPTKGGGGRTVAGSAGGADGVEAPANAASTVVAGAGVG